MWHRGRVRMTSTQPCGSLVRAAASLPHPNGADLRPKNKAHQLKGSASGSFTKP